MIAPDDPSLNMLQMDLAERIAAGASLRDAALACNVSWEVARREMTLLYGGNIGRAKPNRPEFAAGLAMLLLDRGHLVTEPAQGADWDDLLRSIRRYLRRHNLTPPGAYRQPFPGSGKFSLVEQAAMVRKYLRARSEGRSTVYIGQLFMQWGITAMMMDKWRQKFLRGKANPNRSVHGSLASQHRTAIMQAVAAHGAGVVTKTYLCECLPDISDTRLNNRLRELCRAGKLVSIYNPRGAHLGYRPAGRGLRARMGAQAVAQNRVPRRIAR